MSKFDDVLARASNNEYALFGDIAKVIYKGDLKGTLQVIIDPESADRVANMLGLVPQLGQQSLTPSDYYLVSIQTTHVGDYRIAIGTTLIVNNTSYQVVTNPKYLGSDNQIICLKV